MKRALLWVGSTLLTLACATLMDATPTPVSTARHSTLESATSTLSPAPSPSTTPQPRITATRSPSAIEALVRSLTATAAFASPLPTLTAVPQLACELNWQSPANGIAYDPGTNFTTGWKLTNTGTSPWDAARVEFVYRAGAKLDAEPVVHLRVSVAPGASVVLSVAMTAPRQPVMYTTRWSLRKGDTYFCPLSLSFYVNAEGG
jgi:Ig-like domain from next to BRCA1 gene